MKPYVKVYYRRMDYTPFYHTFLEVCDGKIKVKRGFYAKYHESIIYSIISVILPVRGVVKSESKKVDRVITISADRDKAKRLIEAMKRENWKVFHTLFHNCFVVLYVLLVLKRGV